MKVKDDFITNSSSTAYFFIFKGNKEELIQVIKKYPYRFDLEESDNWSGTVERVDASFITESIEKVYGTLGQFYGDNKCIIKPIDVLIKEFEGDVEYWKNQIRCSEEKGEIGRGYYKRYLNENAKQLEEIKEAKERGLDKFLQINFGTSEGHVYGGPACLLHGLNRFRIKRKDLYVVTDVRS